MGRGRARSGWVVGSLVAAACAQPAASPPELSTAVPSANAGTLERLVRDVERVRGLPAKRPIQARVVTPDALRREIEHAVSESRSPDEVARYEAGLVTVGLWPRERSLLPELLAVLTEEVAGLYVVPERALLVVSETPRAFDDWLEAAVDDPQERMVLHHELVHLLQHQRYPLLFENDDLFLVQDDLALAVQSASEGDAVYYGLQADGESPPPELLAASFDLELNGMEGAIASAPLLLQRLLGFPYIQGYRLAHREGAELLESPPASTEQTLHPERRRDDFAVFDLRAVAEQLPPGCDPIFENTVGELQLAVLFEIFGESADRAAELAAGWDGDRYLAARCSGAPALLWLTRWDSPQEAADFEAAYALLAPAIVARTGLAGPLGVERDEREVVVASLALRSWLRGRVPGVREARVRGVEELMRFATGGPASSAAPPQTR